MALWYNSPIMSHELQLLLILAIIIISARLCGHICQRYLRQPAVLGELLAGVILGPTLLNVMGCPIFDPWAGEMVKIFANIGVLLLMFIAGLETNVKEIRKVGKAATLSAIFGVGLPMIGGYLAAVAFGINYIEAIYIGTILTATSVSITAQTLMEINKLRSSEGSTIMGAAVIDDVLGIIILSVVIAIFIPRSSDANNVPSTITDFLSPMLHQWFPVQLIFIVVTMLLMLAFFWVVINLGKNVVPPIFNRVSGVEARHIILSVSLAMLFLMAVSAEFIGQVAAITGAYLAGIFLGRTRFRVEIETEIAPFTYAFFVPIFLASIGIGIDAKNLGGDIIFAIIIIVLAILTKVVGCAMGAGISGFNLRSSLRVGTGMISRGEVGLIIALVGKNAGIISCNIYAVMVLVVLVTTVITPPLLRLSFFEKIEE
jgi:Kef-type K+ transport system membrane component KefB